jgi:hypothetical protein
MKFQTIKTDIRHNLPFSMLDREYPILIKNLAYENLSNLFHNLFIHPEKSNLDNKLLSIKITHDMLETDKNEIDSLQRLENCANAARQTEACGQYEWVNKSDE